MSEEESFFDVALGLKNYNISPSCKWIDVFNNDERRSLHAGLFWACVVSLIVMIWLTMALMKTSLWKDESYRYLTLFTVPAGIRRFLLVISSFFNLRIMSSCVSFAYVDSLFGMLEIEGLTHAFISRFVMARYAAKGWPMNKRFLQYFMYSTIAFAVFYTFLPLTGYGGSYHYDFSCTTCSYDMILPYTPERYFIVFLFFMRYVKPSLMMYIMVMWAWYLEKYVCTDDGKSAREKFTSVMVDVLGSCTECCGCIAIIRLIVIMDQLRGINYKDIIFRYTAYPEIIIKWSYWLYALWPVGAALMLVWKDERIHHFMILPRRSNATDSQREKKEEEQPVEADKQEIKHK